jgi:hypothetical protein
MPAAVTSPAGCVVNVFDDARSQIVGVGDVDFVLDVQDPVVQRAITEFNTQLARPVDELVRDSSITPLLGLYNIRSDRVAVVRAADGCQDTAFVEISVGCVRRFLYGRGVVRFWGDKIVFESLYRCCHGEQILVAKVIDFAQVEGVRW